MRTIINRRCLLHGTPLSWDAASAPGSRRSFLKTLAIAVAAMSAPKTLGSAARGAERPNVIVILTDDQGYGDLSCHGNPVLKTPNLDRLHGQSIRLTDFHVAPMCTPTRGQLMTGLDAMRNGATFVNCQSMMRNDLPTMADLFQATGYRTGLFGKWHLGDSYPHRPGDRGFDTVIRLGAWGITSIADYFGNDYFDDTYQHDGRYEKYEGYCNDVWFAEATRWMKARQEKSERFFCYIPTNVPHAPHWVAERYAEPYKGKGPAEFFGMIANLDENIGRLVRFLEDADLANNTILIFLTDNGTAAGETVYNAGMRGKKRSLYEGGHRVPCFIRWPGGKLGSPRDVGVLAHVQDILPTLIDLCGLKSSQSVDFDGVSLTPFLRGEAKEISDRMLVVQYGTQPQKYDAAVLWNKWRLVGGKELYRVDDDPGQRKNVADQHPDIVRRMRDHYERWWDEVQPSFAQTRWILLGEEQANPTMLYSSDWQGDYADNWGNLAKGSAMGRWNVRVTRPGRYALTLYRWPPESQTALDAPLKGPHGLGTARPIRAARVKIGNVEESKPASTNACSSTFQIELRPGDYTLQTWLLNADDQPLCSAYYVKVERLP